MRYFRIKEVFEIIKFMLLEEPMLFFCEDIHVLTYTIEGLLSLLYPFEYQYPAISVLPEENYSFISIFKHFIFFIILKFNCTFSIINNAIFFFFCFVDKIWLECFFA